MRVLAFDTAMTRCAVALAQDGRLLAHIVEDMSRGHAEALLPMVAMACEAGGLDLAAIDRVALTLGPGSFTGVRVGVAAARGLALATGCGLVGFTCLEAVAAGYYQAGGTGGCVVLQDARRDEIYWQRFSPPEVPDGVPRALDAAAVLPLSQAIRRLQDSPDAVLGTAAGLVKAAYLPPHGPLPDVRVLARMAGRAAPLPADTLEPLYLRPPDAKLPQATPLENLARLRR